MKYVEDLIFFHRTYHNIVITTTTTINNNIGWRPVFSQIREYIRIISIKTSTLEKIPNILQLFTFSEEIITYFPLSWSTCCTCQDPASHCQTYWSFTLFSLYLWYLGLIYDEVLGRTVKYWHLVVRIVSRLLSSLIAFL